MSVKILEKTTVHILNPFAGERKRYDAALAKLETSDERIITGESDGGTYSAVKSLLSYEPYAHIAVYGGDGTANDTVNAIMDSGESDTASFTIVPSGTGNDLSSYINNLGESDSVKIDLIKSRCGGRMRYCANVMNMGFDCDVAADAHMLKTNPFLHGSKAYIAGIVKNFVKKKPIHAKIALTDCVDLMSGERIPDRTFSEDVLLVACANGHYYGGGFHAAPLASVNDSYMDVVIVKDMSRLKFISLVGEYKNGSYISRLGELKEKFASLVSYCRCRKIEIEGADRYCLDGEIFTTGGEPVSAEVVPEAVRYVPYAE